MSCLKIESWGFIFREEVRAMSSVRKARVVHSSCRQSFIMLQLLYNYKLAI